MSRTVNKLIKDQRDCGV